MLVSERVDGLSLVVDSSMHDQRGRRALRAGRASGEDFGKKAAQLNWVGTQSPEDALRAIEDVPQSPEIWMLPRLGSQDT